MGRWFMDSFNRGSRIRGCGGRPEFRDELRRVSRSHQCLANEYSVRSGRADPGCIGAGGDAAFAHRNDVARKTWNQTLAQAEIGSENCQVAVVDADNPGAVSDRALELTLVVDLEKSVETGDACRVEQYLDLLI